MRDVENETFLQQPVASSRSAVPGQHPCQPALRAGALRWNRSELLFRNDNTAVVYLKAEPTSYQSQICQAWHRELALEPSSWSRLYV